MPLWLYKVLSEPKMTMGTRCPKQNFRFLYKTCASLHRMRVEDRPWYRRHITKMLLYIWSHRHLTACQQKLSNVFMLLKNLSSGVWEHQYSMITVIIPVIVWSVALPKLSSDKERALRSASRYRPSEGAVLQWRCRIDQEITMFVIEQSVQHLSIGPIRHIIVCRVSIMFNRFIQRVAAR